MLKNDSSFNVLYTTDITTTHDFYKKVGAEIKQVAEDKVVVGIGSFDLHFILDSTEPFSDYQYIAKPGSYGQGAIFYIESADIEQDQTIIKQAGGTIISALFENMWGAREFLFEDPNGYKFAVWQMK